MRYALLVSFAGVKTGRPSSSMRISLSAVDSTAGVEVSSSAVAWASIRTSSSSWAVHS